ncbi:CLUMA_CG020925, isoform A [Clunio marinus]|uniref:CLUMA_CG020925, isoform A n=1 Tax=Clunio marinus TaxID=568069 RepID=A0A1J1J8K1_9DIPT|nr:CLUMA_CG020925, isoform A [Clunio marinus]
MLSFNVSESDILDSTSSSKSIEIADIPSNDTTTSTISTSTDTTSTSSKTTTVPITPSTNIPTTVNPKTTQSPEPNHHSSHWSTTSFIGGIIFTLGLVAIVFIAWKFYKSRNERNYHTL